MKMTAQVPFPASGLALLSTLAVVEKKYNSSNVVAGKKLGKTATDAFLGLPSQRAPGEMLFKFKVLLQPSDESFLLGVCL